MSRKTAPKISRDAKYQASKGYYKPHVDGFNTDSGNLAFGKPEDWFKSKTRQRMGKSNKPLF